MTAQGEFHDLAGAEDAPAKFAALKSRGRLPADLLGHDTILFKVPPKTGDRFGDPEQTKLGPRYCWVVLDVSTGKLDPPVQGVAADKEFQKVTLTFRTGPDHTNVFFAAGLGVTFFEYVHHGTKGDCEMQLVETGG